MVIKHAETLKEELSSLDTASSRVADEEHEVLETESQANALAARLSDRRSEVAKDFQDQVGRELTALMMKRTQFEVMVEKRSDDHAGLTGQDRVVFRLSANPGEPLDLLPRWHREENSRESCLRSNRFLREPITFRF